MLRFETVQVSITVCPVGKIDKYGDMILIGSIECAQCPCYKGRGAYPNTIICEMEENNVAVKNR